jgi:transposase
MVFSTEDRILIKNLYLLKGYNCARLRDEFPEKNWKTRGLEKLLRKIRETGSCDRRPGSGRPKSARTDDTVAQVEELVLSQDDKPQTHRSTREIARETGLSQSSVVRIIHRDLALKCFKKRRAQELTEANQATRLTRSKMLLSRFTDSEVDFMWFTDEKVFTVATPKNPQNDRVYAPVTSQKKNIAADRLLRTRTTFTKSIMVSVGVSKLGRTHLIFVDPGVKRAILSRNIANCADAACYASDFRRFLHFPAGQCISAQSS